MSAYEKDTEKQGGIFETTGDGAVPGETFIYGNSFTAKLHRIANKFGVEARGIERVPEDERTDHSYSNVGTMWLSANMVISSLAIGVLGPAIFYMGFVDSILTILFFNLLATLSVCFFSCFGPEFGLRQMVLSRFFFGFYGVKIIAFLNCLACIGWSSVNVIVGAQLITTVNGDVPSYAGIIIIAACTFFVTLFGYKIVHAYEKWSWLPVFVIFIIVIVQYAKSGTFVYTAMPSGPEEAASVLSFGAAIFGFGAGWTSYAADYTVYQPKSASKVKIFVWTWAGIMFPLLFTEILGAALFYGTYTSKAYADAYAANSVGGLLGAVLVENSLGKFGQFCLIILALSIIAGNVPNIYSIGLSVQLFSRHLQAVPRFCWTFIGTICYVAIAIPGASHFDAVLSNFMLLIAYWLAIYEAISLSEHFIFRKGFAGYEPADYDTPNRLPVGIAAMVAFLFGVLGAILGMAQVWFVGPIAKKTGNPIYGGDIGFELAFAMTGVVYCAIRPFEKKRFGR